MRVNRIAGWLRGWMVWPLIVCCALLLSAAAALAQGMSLNSATVAQAAQQLGISPAQAQQLQSQVSQNGLSGDQLQQACATVAAKHLGPAEIQSMGSSLGLSADQVGQLQQCAEGNAGAVGAGPGAAANPLAGANQNPAPSAAMTPYTRPSLIENRFHQLETPYKLLAGHAPPRSVNLATRCSRRRFRPSRRSPTFQLAAITCWVPATA